MGSEVAKSVQNALLHQAESLDSMRVAELSFDSVASANGATAGTPITIRSDPRICLDVAGASASVPVRVRGCVDDEPTQQFVFESSQGSIKLAEPNATCGDGPPCCLFQHLPEMSITIRGCGSATKQWAYEPSSGALRTSQRSCLTADQGGVAMRECEYLGGGAVEARQSWEI